MSYPFCKFFLFDNGINVDCVIFAKNAQSSSYLLHPVSLPSIYLMYIFIFGVRLVYMVTSLVASTKLIDGLFLDQLQMDTERV